MLPEGDLYDFLDSSILPAPLDTCLRVFHSNYSCKDKIWPLNLRLFNLTYLIINPSNINWLSYCPSSRDMSIVITVCTPKLVGNTIQKLSQYNIFQNRFIYALLYKYRELCNNYLWAFHRGIIFKSESLNIVINFYSWKMAVMCWQRKALSEKVDLKDLGLFGQLWPQFWSRCGNMKLISEKVTGTNHKLNFEFFECKKQDTD